MSGFSRDWLQLREPADHRSRRDFSAAIVAATSDERVIVDLGCGSGSNLRFLIPRLEHAQHWICIDNDAKLLEALQNEAARVSDGASTVTTRRLDLAANLESALETLHETRGCGSKLVTASALLDLVSRPWLEGLAAGCRSAGAPAWFALTYDGRVELEPALNEDALLRSLINAHQHMDKGFGPALGPAAHPAACEAFARHGYEVIAARSDWVLTPADAELQRELLEGWLGAAREQADDEAVLAQWAAARRAQLDAGTLRIRVGHSDLLALPRVSA